MLMNHINKKCLVKRKYGHIGDLLMLTPALKSLSKTYQVYLQVDEEYFPIFENNPNIHKLISLNEKIEKEKFIFFDVSDYEFNYEQIYQPLIIKTKQELFANKLEVNITSNKPEIYLTEFEENWANEYIKKFNNKKIIVLSPKSANLTRDWPIEKWRALINNLKKFNFILIVVDKELNWEDDSIIFFNNHSLRELFSLISKVNFVVCQDSGLLHISAAFNVPTFSIFGPTDPNYRCIYNKSSFIKLNLACSPCWYERCKNLNCLNLLSVESVEKKLLEVIFNEII
ncbi:MAG: glycosyltransferase family 9 protein [Candidatus ainarchaeum sp.]|nr:glycosyltransferase family 9 protein [Candidatus ainarchaeum sp.]